MKQIQCALIILALGTLLAGVPGCMDQIALFPRPTLPEGEPDVIGSVERVDIGARRLYLRSNSGEPSSVAFTNDAQVLDGGREYPITRLARGDVVAMHIKYSSSGQPYADFVRVQEQRVARGELREQTIPPPQIETLVGTVQRVNRPNNSFALDHQPNPIIVALSPDARDSDLQRFEKLRSGEHVRIEGKFIGRDRFEMLSFLNDED